MAALSSPGDLEETLKVEDKRAEQTLQRDYQANAWAIKASRVASIFTRASLIWLHQIEDRILAGDVRTHQDINKLKWQQSLQRTLL